VPGGAGCTHGAHSPVGAQTVREPDRWLGGNALRADHKIAYQAPTSGPVDLPFIEHGACIKRAAACSKTVSSGMPHRQFLSRNARPHTIRLTHGRPDPVVLASTRRKRARLGGLFCGGPLNIAPVIRNTQPSLSPAAWQRAIGERVIDYYAITDQYIQSFLGAGSRDLHCHDIALRMR
jgi:hypothetical protein